MSTNRKRARASLDEIQRATEEVLRRHHSPSARPGRIRRRLSPYSSSYPIQHIRTEFDHGGDVHMVLKDLSPSANFNTVRPAFLNNPVREIEIYRQVLTPELGTPLFFGALTQPDIERYWLFLERISGPHLWEMGEMQHWNGAAQWLARLHSAPDITSRARKISSVLIQYDRAYFETWLMRADKRLSSNSDINLALWRKFKSLRKQYDHVVNRLLELPHSFIHGDFFPSNILLRNKPKGPRICPIDWELAGIGPRLLDLAALTSGNWEAPERVSMIAAYRDALDCPQGSRLSLNALLEAVDYCELHLSIQFLGWAESWAPPEAHTQDWLRNAVRLATKLGL